MVEQPRTKAFLLLIVLSLIWGTSFILIKQGLKIFSAQEVGALRVSAASIFLLPIALTQLHGLTWKHYARLMASGLMGVFIPAFLFATAQTRMESSVAGILNTLTPIFTMIIGAAIFKQRFSTLSIIGMVLGLGGAVVLSLARSNGGFTGFNSYALLIVIACFFYASNLNLIKFKISDLHAIKITSVSLMLIGPLALLYLFLFTGFTEKMASHEGAWRAFGFIVLLGLMSTAVATFIFNQLVKISTPLFASSVTYLIPIVAVMWGFLDHEELHIGHLVGMLCVVTGVYLANKKK
jgi:drug/metabolite transporter (DMT)-like permease